MKLIFNKYSKNNVDIFESILELSKKYIFIVSKQNDFIDEFFSILHKINRNCLNQSDNLILKTEVFQQEFNIKLNLIKYFAITQHLAEKVKQFNNLLFNRNGFVININNTLIAEILNSYLVASKLHNKSEVVESLGMFDVDISPENTAIYYFNGEMVSEHTISDYGTIFSSFKETQDIIYWIGNYLRELMFKQQNKIT
jgi:hypothetical protein